MTRYLKLLWCFMKSCVMRDMEYRLNFVTNMLTDFVYNLLKILFIEIVFLQVNELAGLNRYHFLFFFGTSFLVNSLFMLFVFFNHIQIPHYVQSGNLDFILTKPISAQFMLSCRYFNLAGVGNIFFGVYLIWYSLKHLNLNFTILNCILYVILVLCGFLLYYSFSLFLHAWAFWTVKTGGFLDILIDVAEIMKYPPRIFPHLVQIILSFAIPLFMIAGYPAQISLGLIPWTFTIWNIAISFIAFGLASYFLKIALKRYASASS